MNDNATSPRDMIPKAPAMPVITLNDADAFAALSIEPEEFKELLAANIGPAGITEFNLPRIKVPAGDSVIASFELLDANAPQGVRAAPTFEAIILQARDIRAYWSSDEAGNNPPDCHSNDCVTGIGNPGGLCGTDETPICPLAAWGSESKKGVKTKGQACKHMKQLFIARRDSNNWLPEVINAPPTALDVFRTYSIRLLGMRKPLNTIVTEFSLTPQKNASGKGYSRLAFRPVAELSPEVKEKFRSYTTEMSLVWRREPVQIAQPTVLPALPRPEREKAF